jgi:hypothetical protein
MNGLITEELPNNDCDDEQNLADKVEPKFHEGQWIIHKERKNFMKITKTLPFEYKAVDAFGSKQTVGNESAEKYYRPWTIQDAKDGDVLSDGTTIFIFKDLLSDGSVMSYCDYDTDSGESDAFCPLSVNLMCSKITPSTKEQRDLFFKKMNEASYEWNADKKELKPIIDEKQIKKNLQNNSFRRMFEQKHVWSEEDEGYMDRILEALYDYYPKRYAQSIYDWLKSLKNSAH